MKKGRKLKNPTNVGGGGGGGMSQKLPAKSAKM